MERQTIGRYEVRGILGRGHSGTVHDGWDPVIERRVAIKALPLPDLSTPEGQDRIHRFRREAHVSGRLTHPNIIVIHDYGETADLAYIVMEYVDGADPVTFLKQSSTAGSTEAVRIIREVLAALRFSHEQGVVHRDIKPSNVMVTAAGHVKIGDFGIARTENSRLTQVGMQIGTPAYMSPEQLVGETADARSDIYSVGILLYQLLTGEKPFDGSLTSIIHKALNTRPPRPSELSLTAPPQLDPVVERAMAKRPEDRFQTAAEFSEALRAASADQAGRPARVFAASPVDPYTTVIDPAVAAPGTGGPAQKAPRTKGSLAAALTISGVLLIVVTAAVLAYVAANWQTVAPLMARIGLPVASPAARPAGDRAFGPPPDGKTAQIGRPAAVSPVASAPKPAGDPVFGPPPEGKSLAEAIIAFIPTEKQMGERDNIERYAKDTLLHRSLGVTSDGSTWRSSPFGSTGEATDRVLEGCQIYYGKPCATVAIDGTVLAGELTIRPMPRVAYSGPFDPERVPAVRPPRLLEADVVGYKAAAGFKAMALHPWGRVFTATLKTSQQAANDAVLTACAEDPDRRGRSGSCYLYAEGDTIVLNRRIAGPPRPPAEALGPDALLDQLAVLAFPQTNQSARSEAQAFLGRGLNRAMAFNPQTGTVFSWSRRPTAIEVESGVLEGCQLVYGSACRIVVLNNEIRGIWEPVRNQSRVTYSGPFDPRQIPMLELLQRSSSHVTEYASAPAAKAMAMQPSGFAYTAVGRTSQAAADDAALDACSREPKPGGVCYLYASGNQVVLSARQTRPTTGLPPQPPPAAR